MKNTRRLNSLIIAVITIILIQNTNAQSKLTMTWGIENTSIFEETKATKDQNSTLNPSPKKTDKKYRFIHPSRNYNTVLQSFFERHKNIWERFEKENPVKEQIKKSDFAKFAKKNDPYYYELATSMAPQLYFDFIGINNEYVLMSVEVETIAFSEYRGGGFSDKTAWYDIELKHQLGKHIYEVENNKLRFTNSGRTVLRLFSDNYYPRYGITPSGCYMISIKFNFKVNGKNESVSTGAFKIDV